jgi:hypothetical protein
MDLLDSFVAVASWGTGQVQYARELISSLPREWVLERIERTAEAHLRGGTEWEYRRILELNSELDPNLTIRLARRAAAHSDAEIREAGEAFLEDFAADGGPTGDTGL